MPRPAAALRPLLRLNTHDFEAFLRGTRRAGRIAIHRKLDAAAIATGTWRNTGSGAVQLQLRVDQRARGAVRLALQQLAALQSQIAPRKRIRTRLTIGRHRLLQTLPQRGPLRPLRSSGGARGPGALRARIAATLAQIPADYAELRRLQRQREARVLAFAGIDVAQRECWLLPQVARRLRSVFAAAARDGIQLQLVSGFRSATNQARILERKSARGEPMAQILTINAAPGFSEHHSGRAVDLTAPGFAPIEEPFERSDAFAWLQQHAADLCLRLSYPRNNPHGIVYEPWHWYFERR
jgi:D-alanyl-D-alanine carboxypeptidase